MKRLVRSAAAKVFSSRLSLPAMRLLLRGHNALYRAISFGACKANGGVHPKHEILKYHAFFLKHIPPGGSVLDVGCGQGEVAKDIASVAKSVVGIDISATYIAWAKKHNAARNVEFIVGDATTHDFGRTFDCAVISNVLEHIEDRVGMLKKLAALAPRILIRVPMVDRDWMTSYKKMLGVESRLDDTHFTEYTEDSFDEELARAGLVASHKLIRFGEIWAVIDA